MALLAWIANRRARTIADAAELCSYPIPRCRRCRTTAPPGFSRGPSKKGKAKHVLAIEAILRTGGGANADTLCLQALVNGVAVEPLTGGLFAILSACPAQTDCTLTATFWLDLDAAEAANPGVFVGQPLKIDLQGGDFKADGGGAVFVSTMTARMEKK